MVLGAGYEIRDCRHRFGHSVALGDGGDVDRFVDCSCSDCCWSKDSAGRLMPHLYAAADTIDLTVATATVWAIMVNV